MANIHSAATDPSPVQEKLARRITTIVLAGTCAFGILGIVIAIIAIRPGSDITGSKDVIQTLFSAILPLFGTWIGTILAFYFSKENLLAANQTVRHLVDRLTSDKKLESTKAIDVMIPLEKLKYKEYVSEEEADKFNLRTDFLNWLDREGISRVILLDSSKVAKYVLHRSLIEGFLAQQYLESSQIEAPNEDANRESVRSNGGAALTFGDLRKKGNARVQLVLTNGVKFVREGSNLSDARVLLKNTPSCNDVFITKNGIASEPVLGWVTEKTIVENIVVD